MTLIAVSDIGIAQSSPKKIPNAASTSISLFESMQDPPGQPPSRFVFDDNSLGFGGIEETSGELRRSDIGFSMYFIRVPGGVRVRDYPIVFPDRSHSKFAFLDYDCSVARFSGLIEVVCRDKKDKKLYHSTIKHGSLISLEFRCMNKTGFTCYYRLINGIGIRPSKVH